jgi:hypothetical protein
MPKCTAQSAVTGKLRNRCISDEKRNADKAYFITIIDDQLRFSAATKVTDYWGGLAVYRDGFRVGI